MKAHPPVPPESPPDIARSQVNPRGLEALSGLWLLIVLIPVSAWVYILLVPTKTLPVNIGNGSYANPCCVPLTLWNGQARSADVVFSYLIIPGKSGPLVLLQHQTLNVDQGRLVLGQGRAGQFLPLDKFTPPRSIEVGGVTFVRLAGTAFGPGVRAR